MESRLPIEIEDENLLNSVKEKRREAVKNLVEGITPENQVYYKPSGFSSKPLKYVKGGWVVEQLNLLFWGHWDFKVINQGVVGDQIWVLGELTVRNVVTGEAIVKSQYGGSRIKSKTNQNIDIGDDFKSAATDSLKKAAYWLGIAADTFAGVDDEVSVPGSADAGQINAVYVLGKRAGMSDEEIDKFSEDKFGSKVPELKAREVLALVKDLRAKIAK